MDFHSKFFGLQNETVDCIFQFKKSIRSNRFLNDRREKTKRTLKTIFASIDGQTGIQLHRKTNDLVKNFRRNLQKAKTKKYATFNDGWK